MTTPASLAKPAKGLDLLVVVGAVSFLAMGALTAYLYQGKASRPLDASPATGKVIAAASIDGSDDVNKAEPDKVLVPPLSPDAVATVPIPSATDKKPVPYLSTKSTQLAIPPKDDGTYQYLTFETLSNFLYELPDPEEPKTEAPAKGMARPKDQIPASVHALDGRKVTVQGFMLPFSMDQDGMAKTFLLLRNQNFCCNGQQMQVNEWIKVKMKNGGRARVVQDVPLTVHGTLQVGEELQSGYVVSIYRLEADRVDEP